MYGAVQPTHRWAGWLSEGTAAFMGEIRDRFEKLTVKQSLRSCGGHNCPEIGCNAAETRPCLRLEWRRFVMNDKKTSVRRCCTGARSHGRGPGERNRVWIVFPAQANMWSMKDCDSVSARSWKQTHKTCFKSTPQHTDASPSRRRVTCLFVCCRLLPAMQRH